VGRPQSSLLTKPIHCSCSIGCIWVSAAADFGPDGVLERYVLGLRSTILPSALILKRASASSKSSRPFYLRWMQSRAHRPRNLSFEYHSCAFSNKYRYNGKVHPHIPKVRALLSGLSQRSIKHPKVVIIDAVAKGNATASDTLDSSWIQWDDFVALGASSKLGRSAEGEIEWARLGFDWPLWILFSSGTTGLPKLVLFLSLLSVLHFNMFQGRLSIEPEECSSRR
jgi:acetoacetyl-CoA synthetase